MEVASHGGNPGEGVRPHMQQDLGVSSRAGGLTPLVVPLECTTLFQKGNGVKLAEMKEERE